MNTSRPAESLAAFLRYFLYLGTVGFGGPIALVGYMQRDLVEDRLTMYLGWVRARVLGATLVPPHCSSCCSCVACPNRLSSSLRASSA